MKAQKVTIRGKRWNLEFVRLRKNWGECDPPDKPRKAIRIRSSLKGGDRLNTIIHEVLHAGHWELKEDVVDKLASDIERILTKLGYELNEKG